MMKTCPLIVLVVVCGVVGLGLALPAGPAAKEDTKYLTYVPRAVKNPKTPNQILDAIFERTLAKLKAIGWDSSKNVQNGNSEFPLDVNADTKSGETFSISSAKVTGLGSLRRSKSGSFNSAETVLSGTAVVENARAVADYTVTFPGVGQAPSQTVNGQVTENVNKLFADIEINMKDGVPQSIRSYSTRSGHDNLEQATNLNGNSMAGVHTAGFRKSLRQVLESTMAKNMKVQINKSIQDWKNGN